MPTPDDRRSPDAVAADLVARAVRQGFAVAGVCEAAPSAHADHVRRWFAAGKHGSMDWLADELEARLDPRRLLPGARSVLCLADRYSATWRDQGVEGWPPRGRLARYARGEDYHVVVRKRLRALAARLRSDYPGEEFRICCDLLPILEREMAARAGLGRIGKHTLLIEHGGGSYLLLGEVVTTLDAARTTVRAGALADPCGSCVRCIEACPTRAIEPWSVDASKCLSYTSIEHRGEIDEAFWEATGDWFFGCDICQEVCPHNRPTRSKRRKVHHPAYDERRTDFDLLAVLGWSEADRLQASLRSALRRAKLEMLKRNAIICLANALASRPDPVIVDRIRDVARNETEDELVRSTARSALRRLGRTAD